MRGFFCLFVYAAGEFDLDNHPAGGMYIIIDHHHHGRIYSKRASRRPLQEL